MVIAMAWIHYVTWNILALWAAQPLLWSAAPTHPIIEKKSDQFRPFTGRVLSNKVRIRAKPDLESHIIRQVNKKELLLVVGEEGDFYAIQPPEGTKAYLFRSYVLDQVVEADRVNVRLEPHADAPIIAQLNMGTKVCSTPCAMNPKWLEIAPPADTRFYIAKEFVESAGGPEFLAHMERRKAQAEKELAAALCLFEAESKKPFEEMSPGEVAERFQKIAHDFADFPEIAAQAKETHARVKEAYLHQKIAFLEGHSHPPTDSSLVKQQQQHAETILKPKKPDIQTMCYWDVVEESLYLSWAAFHPGKKIDEFYLEQKANGLFLEGTVEPYTQSVKNKPGDYILRNRDVPVAYLYSTGCNLEEYVGKEVTLLATPRPNHQFAFPAYFVLAVE